MSNSESSSTTPSASNTSTYTTKFGMAVSKTVSNRAPFATPTDAAELRTLDRTHRPDHEDEPYFESANDPDQKIEAALELIQQSRAVLVKTEPWFVKNQCGTDDFSRWEPYFLAFPATAHNKQVKFTNIAPLTEVAYTLSQRDQYMERARNDESADGEYSLVEYAQMAEQRAYTRHALDSACLGSFDSEYKYPTGTYVDPSIISVIIGSEQPLSDSLQVKQAPDGDGLLCTRAPLADNDVRFGLDRYVYNQEYKVRLFNEEGTTEALKAVGDQHWDSTHMKYLSPISHWQCDLSGIPVALETLLEQPAIDTVGIHRVTEKAIMTHVDGTFGDSLLGYPGF